MLENSDQNIMTCQDMNRSTLNTSAKRYIKIPVNSVNIQLWPGYIKLTPRSDRSENFVKFCRNRQVNLGPIGAAALCAKRAPWQVDIPAIRRWRNSKGVVRSCDRKSRRSRWGKKGKIMGKLWWFTWWIYIGNGMRMDGPEFDWKLWFCCMNGWY